MATTDALSIPELAEHVWEVADQDDYVTFGQLAHPCEWPLDKPQTLEGSSRPRTIDGRQTWELVGALAKQAVADGWAAEDVLRAFADGLDPVPR
ncbi:MAG TPA: hypothetical protein VH061_07820 [Solirubrobacteraceae bacterium]|jgi:hypothetical protein|nr:hypothetical protein [Solirubrobacteraceae bacterium]